MAVSVNPAASEDINDLLGLMAEFYAESDCDLTRELYRQALDGLIEDSSLGEAWLMRHDGQRNGNHAHRQVPGLISL